MHITDAPVSSVPLTIGPQVLAYILRPVGQGLSNAPEIDSGDLVLRCAHAAPLSRRV